MYHAHMYHPDIYKYNTQSTQLQTQYTHKHIAHRNDLQLYVKQDTTLYIVNI